jgi:Aspartyl protease
MRLQIRDSIPFTSLTIACQNKIIEVSDVPVDTGSARTILSADAVADIDITPSPDDPLYTIRGVGGTGVVFSRHIDYIQLGNQQLLNFEIEVGGMDDGFNIKGILGMDFLRQAGALLNLATTEIEFS